ncbi:MAG TPA: hypothetical protein VKZ95_04495, partial [Sphingobacteriaceae bacterium]|nr:hypothetical protein [Sphingobacteriaceae bacterium]
MKQIKKLTMGAISFLILVFFYSCEIERIEPAKPVDDVEKPKTESPDSETEGDDNETGQDSTESDKGSGGGDQKLEVIGNGSGKLIIKDVENKRYSIKPGTYSSFHLENIKSTSLEGFGQVKVKGGTVYISKVNGLSLTGVAFEDSSQPAINIYDEANDITIKDVSFKNIGNSAIRFLLDKKYDGTPKSYSKNIHLINIKAENIGSLFGTRGEIKSDGFYGLIKGFKLINSTIINSPKLSNGIYVGCVEDYEVSNNVVNNVNKSENYPGGNNNHNGIFHMNGNGKIFKNKITNHQGNAVRAWLFTITKPNAQVEIYDNVVYNSTRYSAFELQVPPYMEVLPSFVPANAKIYNNTIGRLNTGQPKFYEGRIVDIYQTHGNVEVYNNLYFNMRDNIVSLNQSKREDTKV